ncbi:MAG: leucine-rich repeat protein [Thermoguttaceae bacterium]|nr:leucine-rich repeat protein [Thermoguttaceae bacterium]
MILNNRTIKKTLWSGTLMVSLIAFLTLLGGSTPIVAQSDVDQKAEYKLVASVGLFEKYLGNAETFTVPEGIVTIAGYAFSNSLTLEKVVLPSGVTSVRDHAFAGCPKLKTVVIPSSCTNFKLNAFYNSLALSSIEVEEDNSVYRSIDGVLFTKSGKTLLICPAGKEAENYVVPDGVETIREGAFARCSLLKKIVLPESVKEIGDGAFAECSSLKEIVLPKGLTTLGECAFRNCDSLSNVDIPNGLTELKNGTFMSCCSLKSIEAPEGVTSIGDYAFNACGALTQVVLPESLERIGSLGFSECVSLESIVIPARVAVIGKDAFSNCHKLKSIKLAENNAAFKLVDGSLYTKDGETLVCRPILLENRSIYQNEYVVPDGVKRLDKQEIMNNNNNQLRSITLSSDVREVEPGALDGSSLARINVATSNSVYRETDDGLLFNDGILFSKDYQFRLKA